MDIWQILRITIRRWYVAAPILVLGVVASYAAADRVAIQYSSGASVLLVSPEALVTPGSEAPVSESPDTTLVPPDSALEGTGNPWLSFTGSLNTAAQAIQLSVLSQETARTIDSEGLSPDYEITTDRRSPIILIEVTSGDPDLTQETLERLVTLVEDDLTRRQVAAGAPESRRIHAEILSMDDTPERAVAARLRVRLGVLALGVVAAVLGAVAFDSIARLSRRRRGRAGVERPDDPARPTTPADMDDEPRVLVLSGQDAPAEHDRPGRPAGRERIAGAGPDPDPATPPSEDAVITLGGDEEDDEVAVGASASRRGNEPQGFAVWTSRSPFGGHVAL
jgi:hypothetical protein